MCIRDSLHSVGADLTWGDDGDKKRCTISHAANLIMTNGWWVTRTTLHGQTLASIEWSNGSSSITWHRVEEEPEAFEKAEQEHTGSFNTVATA